MALKTVPFNVVLTFSRPAPADYEDINGGTQTAGVDEPRFNYNNGVAEGLMLDASLSETAAINDIPNFNANSGTWVVKADLDKSKPIPGSGFDEFMEGSGTLVFVYSNGAGKCWADGEVLYTVDSFSAAEPGFLSNGGLAKIKSLKYYPYAWSDEKAAAESNGEFSIYYSPLFLFADGTDGYWGDSSDAATRFKDVAGTDPATTADDEFGLRLDKSKGLTLGPELLPADVNEVANWTEASSITLSQNGDKIRCTASGTNARARFDSIPTTEGAWYEYTCTYELVSGNDRQFRAFVTETIGTTGVYVSEIGPAQTFTVKFRATGSVARLWIWLSGSDANQVVDFSVDSLRELPGHHQYQSTTAQKGTYQTDGTYHWIALDGDDDNYLIDVPAGGWAGTYVQGTMQGVIVGEFAAPEGPYQIPTDPNFANAGTDTQLVLVNRVLADHELEGLVAWVGEHCAVADFAGETSAANWFRNRTDLTAVDVSRWDLSLLIDWSGAFLNTNLSQQSYTDIVTAIELAGTSNGTLDITGGGATTTGAAQTAVDALRARGWTVTTPDGY